MSTETPASASPEKVTWPVLPPKERRVLGVLVEKAKTTPDAYPLSLNALATGCNQKSNRDPVMNLDEVEVDGILSTLSKQGLVSIITGGRVDRWKHNLYENWKVDKVELAVLGELLLRGPQTEGELRGRASRMEPIPDLAALRAVLQALTSRGLVVYLTPEGRRGAILSHAFHSPAEKEHVKNSAPAEPAESESVMAVPSKQATLETRLTQALDEIADLKNRVQDLESKLTNLTSA